MKVCLYLFVCLSLSLNFALGEKEQPVTDLESGSRSVGAKGLFFDNKRTSGKDWVNSIGMKFMWIPPGSFTMGSPPSEAGRDGHEGPQHKVTIKKGFWLGKYEVTQKQWQQVMGSSPSRFKGSNLPVEKVSWNKCQEFIKKLNSSEGSLKYKLPSESQWEYACRGGTKTTFCFGSSITTEQANGIS